MPPRFPALRYAVAALIAGGALAAAAVPWSPRAAAPPALAAPPPSAPAQAVWLLATVPWATQTTLHRAPLGGDRAGPALATLEHLPDGVVRGRALRGTDAVIAAAEITPGRDRSYNMGLFRVQPGAAPELLCDRVAHASWPLVTPAARVFVARGTAGPPPLPGPDGKYASLRVDALTIEEVDPGTGVTRVVLQHEGQLAFLAGAYGRELIVYRIAPSWSDLVAVDADTGALRPLGAVLPYARSFSIDEAAGALIFQERDETDSRTWVIDRLDLATGQRQRLHAGPSHALAPHAWPGGGIAYNPDRSAGLALMGAAVTVSGPLGAGVDAVQAVGPDGAWVALVHTNPSALPVPYAVRAATGQLASIPAPAGARVEIAGFAPPEGAK